MKWLTNVDVGYYHDYRINKVSVINQIKPTYVALNIIPIIPLCFSIDPSQVQRLGTHNSSASGSVGAEVQRTDSGNSGTTEEYEYDVTEKRTIL